MTEVILIAALAVIFLSGFFMTEHLSIFLDQVQDKEEQAETKEQKE